MSCELQDSWAGGFEGRDLLGGEDIVGFPEFGKTEQCA
jgi:hypothetical protein